MIIYRKIREEEIGTCLQKNVVDRRMYNLDKKKVIAAKAFKLIKNNETIFLDVSTTNIELARLIASSGMHVVVVSNMIDILQILAANPSITAIGTGGTMYRSVNGFMGAAAIEVIKQYSFDRAFWEAVAWILQLPHPEWRMG